jgi:DNA topoisomerase-1
VQIIKGRWGPFITDGKKNARIPKEREAESMSLAECEELLAAAPDKKPRRGTKKAAAKKAPAKKTAKKATKKKAKKKKTKKKARKKTAKKAAATADAKGD